MQASSSRGARASQSPNRQGPLDLNEIVRAAASYGDSHRCLLHYLIRNGTLLTKNFYAAYIRIYANGRQDIEAKSGALTLDNVDEANVDKLTETLMKTMNEKIVDIGLRIARTENGVDGKSVVAIISERHHSAAVAAATGLSQDEQYMVVTWIEAMCKDGEGFISLDEALAMVRDLPNPLPPSKAQALIEQLEKGNIFQLDGDDVTLSVRGVMELDPMLGGQFHMPRCDVCQRICFRSSHSMACPACETRMHPICWKRWSDRSQGDTVKCPASGCKENMSKAEMEEELVKIETLAEECVNNNQRVRQEEETRKAGGKGKGKGKGKKKSAEKRVKREDSGEKMEVDGEGGSPSSSRRNSRKRAKIESDEE